MKHSLQTSERKDTFSTRFRWQRQYLLNNDTIVKPIKHSLQTSARGYKQGQRGA